MYNSPYGVDHIVQISIGCLSLLICKMGIIIVPHGIAVIMM